MSKPSNRAVAWRHLNGGEDTQILGGNFAFAGAHTDMLLGSLPASDLKEDRQKEVLRWALELMRRELAEGQPGGVLVAQHLAHRMLVQAFRLYPAEGAGRALLQTSGLDGRSPLRCPSADIKQSGV